MDMDIDCVCPSRPPTRTYCLLLTACCLHYTKAIYSNLFDDLVRRINAAVGGERGMSIGVLDIFGFEIFEVNSLLLTMAQQLCINYLLLTTTTTTYYLLLTTYYLLLEYSYYYYYYLLLTTTYYLLLLLLLLLLLATCYHLPLLTEVIRSSK